MYAIFALTFILAMIAMADLGTENSADLTRSRATAVADQMAAYHQASLRTCLSLGCAAGTVDPSAELPATLGSAPLYGGGSLRSVSDGSDAVWTYYRLSTTERAAGGYGDVGRALAEIPGISAAPYDADREEVIVGLVRDGAALRAITVAVPNGVGGNTINDGAPVIVTRLR